MLQGHGTELHWYKNSVTFCTDVIRSFIGKSFQMRMLILGWSPPQGAVRPENKERVSLSGAFYLGLIKGDKGHCRRIDTYMLVLIILCKELTSLDVLQLSLLLLSAHHLQHLQM